jgi:hypothetical protein
VTTGTLAILAAQPTDVVKVRMQAAGNRGQYKVRLILTRIVPAHVVPLSSLTDKKSRTFSEELFL